MWLSENNVIMSITVGVPSLRYLLAISNLINVANFFFNQMRFKLTQV